MGMRLEKVGVWLLNIAQIPNTTTGTLQFIIYLNPSVHIIVGSVLTRVYRSKGTHDHAPHLDCGNCQYQTLIAYSEHLASRWK